MFKVLKISVSKSTYLYLHYDLLIKITQIY